MSPYRHPPRFVDLVRLLRCSRLTRLSVEVALVTGLATLLCSVLRGVDGSSSVSASAPTVAASPPLAEGTYVLLSRASTHCLEAPAGTDRRAPLSSRPCWETQAQDWILTAQGGGDVYTLQSAMSGSCLDLPYSEPSPRRLIEYPCHGNTNQRWRLVPKTDGAFAIQSLRTGACATLVGTVSLQEADCEGGPRQEWLVTRVARPDLAAR